MNVGSVCRQLSERGLKVWLWYDPVNDRLEISEDQGDFESNIDEWNMRWGYYGMIYIGDFD